MTYNITLTNGQLLVQIADGTKDTSYSSISLFGKNYAGYGPELDENQVKMLENFSNITPPPSPLEGQLWWDSNNHAMKVYRKDIQRWEVTSGPTSATSSPTNKAAGDLWWDSDNKQLKVFTGTDWITVGPAYKAGQGVSGPVVASIPGATDGLYHTLVIFYIGGIAVSVLSSDAAFDVNAIPGFSIIRPGFNLLPGAMTYVGNAENALSLGGVLAANFLRSDVVSQTNHVLKVKTNDGLMVGLNDDLTIGVTGSAVTLTSNVLSRSLEFYTNIGSVSTLGLHLDGTTGLITVAGDPTDNLGVATKHYVDTLITTTAADFLRKDGTTMLFGSLLPNSTDIYTLGSSSNIYSKVYANVVIATTGQFGSLTANGENVATQQYVNATVNDLTSGNSTFSNLSITGSISTPSNGSVTIGAANNKFGSIYGTVITANTFVSTTSITTPSDGLVDIGTSGNKFGSIYGTVITANTFVATTSITTTSNGTVDIGTSGNKFGNIYGTAMAANYADLAEKYVADADYESGTVLDFGGSHEVTLSTGLVPSRVAGVVSTNPAYLMNDDCSGHFVAAVALQGRCPCKVVGPIQKGDLLVSAGDGRAKAAIIPTVGSVIGKALEDISSREGIIEISVGRC